MYDDARLCVHLFKVHINICDGNAVRPSEFFSALHANCDIADREEDILSTHIFCELPMPRCDTRHILQFTNLVNYFKKPTVDIPGGHRTRPSRTGSFACGNKADGRVIASPAPIHVRHTMPHGNERPTKLRLNPTVFH